MVIWWPWAQPTRRGPSMRFVSLRDKMPFELSYQ